VPPQYEASALIWFFDGIINASAVLDVPELLTTVEVAAMLKVNRSTLSRSRSAGAGPRVTWRTLAWASIVQGRRIHDLRHTAACLWLASCTIWEPRPIGPVWAV
jgi:S-adenosylmethionine:diacylglycerol 3-amino-3-carboxypropyl transferase